MNTTMEENPAIVVPLICCRDGTDAARQGHLACLKSLHEQGNFLGFHDAWRAEAGEVRRAQAWLAALAACDAQHPEVLSWLLAGGWPSSEAERLPWHFRDMADPSILSWYTEGQPSTWYTEGWPGVDPYYKAPDPFVSCPVAGVTAVDWDAPGDWSEMADLAGLRDPRSRALSQHNINGGIWGKPGAYRNWFPQEIQVLWRACRSGNLACQQIIVRAGCRSRWVSVLAALTGRLEFLKFAIEQGCPCEGSTFVAAAAGGHVDAFKHVLKTWFNNKKEVTAHDLEEATRDGKEHCSPGWFFSERFAWDYEGWRKALGTSMDQWIMKAAVAATENGHLDVLKCIVMLNGQARQNGRASIALAGSANPASVAVSHGRLQCLELLCAYGCRPDPDSVRIALETGRTDCVPYLISHGLDMSYVFGFLAAKHGHLELLVLQADRELTHDEAAYDQAVLCHNEVAMGAAIGIQLACLQFALQNGDGERLGFSLRAAAKGGDASCMQFLHEEGYPAAQGTLSAAVESGSLQCVEYAFEIGCPGAFENEGGLMVAAARHGVGIVQCLHEQGCPWQEGTTEAAARRGCLATLRYCHEHGCGWDPDVIRAAISAGSAACLQYIHTHRCPPLPRCCPPAYNQEVLQYAVENMGEWGQGLLLATSENLRASYKHQFADWRLLTYMSQMKAALPRALQLAAESRAARFKEVVSCFHLATHMANHGGPHAPMWAAMGLIPHAVLERITQMAHLRL